MIQHALAAYLVNAAWQAPVAALAALLVARFAGLSPKGRHRVWLAFLIAAVLLPAVSLEGVLPHATPTVVRVAPTAAVEAPMVSMPEPAAAVEPALSLAPWAVWLMAGLCAAVALFLLARLAAAGLAARRLVREAHPASLPAEARQAVEDLARAHNRAVPPILSSAAVAGPAVVGALRPVILLPSDLDVGSEALRAALLHEMAHVLRRDYAVNLACEVLTLPLSWHPALLGLKAGVRRSRELACDAIAASAMASPKTYAQCLLSLAQSLGAQAAGGGQAQTACGGQAALAVGLFGRSDLEDRLMHLMTPKDAEGSFIHAVRACGLAAVGASLLGSAVLLHVTPVFAQPAVTQAAPAPPASPVAAAPAVAPAPAASANLAADQAQRDAAKSAARPHRSGIVFSDKGTTIEIGDTGHRHSWTAVNGHTMTVFTDSDAEPTAEQKTRWETVARDAEVKAEAAEKLVNSPEFKARIEKAKAEAAKAQQMVNSPEFKARIAKAEAEGRAAEAMVNSPEFKAQIARAASEAAQAQAMANSPEFKAQIARAAAQAQAARAMADSPEFKAQIARAKAAGEDARRYVNSPEFKARIAAAKVAGEEASRYINSPEFQAQLARTGAWGMAADMRARLHEEGDSPSTTPTP
jgi:beta-lactamase regulating signal transducer with metallopeptidase domain